jgi:hypothetical protein
MILTMQNYPRTSIVIFGTGSSGMRALRAAANHPNIDVVGFSDNDSDKHGSRIEGVPIIPPTQLGATACDFIVLASQFAREIHAGLLALGVDEKRLVIASLNDFPGSMAALAKHAADGQPVQLEDGRQIEAIALPRVLILTYETLNQSHGTGVMVQRYFCDFPADHLFSISHHANGEPWLRQSLTLSPEISLAQNTQQIRHALSQYDFVPDLVYATAFDEVDLDVLAAALEVIPHKTPVIQHFMDYMPHDDTAFDSRFVNLSSRITETWALTEGLARSLSSKYGRTVEHVTTLHQTPPDNPKRNYSTFALGFRTIMLGNLWQPWMLPLLERVWSACMQELPGLRPVEWYAHPLRVQAVIDLGYELGDSVVWKGFLNDSLMRERVSTAELAILPFNADASARDGYTRYSLPSRLTELCGAGLPIVIIASSDTEPARFAADNGCASVISGPDEELITRSLLRFIADQPMRQQLGTRARWVAEEKFSIADFKTRFITHLVRLAGPGRTPDIDTKTANDWQPGTPTGTGGRDTPTGWR